MSPVTSEQIIAGATVVNVAVTAVYAFFTWRLWLETRRQAELTKQQAELTKQQAGLAKQQAEQTRDMFESTHRPWLSIEPFQRYPFTGSQVRLEFRLRNHGPSPAFVTRWVRHWDLDSSDRPPLTPERGEQVTWCVLPGGISEALEIKFGDPGGVLMRGSRLEVGALYRGADERVHRTRLVATLRVKGQDSFDLESVRHEAD
jgi:hypothetical protein